MEISKQVFWCALFGGIGGMVFTALLFKILPARAPVGRRGQERDEGENNEGTRRPQNRAGSRQCTKLPQEHDERKNYHFLCLWQEKIVGWSHFTHHLKLKALGEATCKSVVTGYISLSFMLRQSREGNYAR
ncbi:uncharacterized protein [Montipora capricornis]|uniref:uncharacterized protein n=1 Tax=Montipora capricornis TaxID=246305 RepID=UPI0035F1F26C